MVVAARSAMAMEPDLCRAIAVLGTLLTGIVAMIFGPRAFVEASENARLRPISSILLGLLTLILIPIIGIILIGTVIGITSASRCSSSSRSWLSSATPWRRPASAAGSSGGRGFRPASWRCSSSCCRRDRDRPRQPRPLGGTMVRLCRRAPRNRRLCAHAGGPVRRPTVIAAVDDARRPSPPRWSPWLRSKPETATVRVVAPTRWEPGQTG